jgi:putative phosphoesterase
MKILIIGDAHIPRRAKEIPSSIIDKLKELSSLQLFDYTFFTGDLIEAPEFIQFLNLHTKKDAFIVIGNMDYYGGNRKAPINRNLQLTIGTNEVLNIGLIHGHQISPRGDHSQLEHIAIENDYDILISGHTHKDEVYLTNQGKLLINPGSVTGAWSFVATGVPSFIVLNINEITGEISTILYIYGSTKEMFTEQKSYFMLRKNRIENLS